VRGEGRSKYVSIMLGNTLSDALRGNHFKNFGPPTRPPGPPGSINCLTSHLKYLFDTLQTTGAWQWWRPRARTRICGACPHMSWAALVAAASGCLNGTQNAPPAGCRLSAVCPGARRRDAADEFFATSRTRQDMRGRATHIMCSSGGSGQRLP